MSKIGELLGTDFACQVCGQTHRVALKDFVFADDALAQLPAVCARHSAGLRLNLFADERTYEVAGKLAEERLGTAGFEVSPLIVPDPAPGHSPVCDDVTRAWIEERLPAADLYVAVGSGVVSDLVKWIAGDRQIPYVAVATAASMNGYSSDNIAPTLRGVKSLLNGKGAVAILAVPGIVANAPREMTAAGLGDVLAKPVSSSDWRLNKVLFDEYYCSFCTDLINEIQPLYLDHPDEIGRRSEAGIAALFEALILTGLSMSMAGTSSPASGGEHLISHCLDMMAMLDGTPHDLHGRQVGIGTIVGAALYEEVMAIERPHLVDHPGKTDHAFWGRFTDAVEAEHAKKRAKAARAIKVLTHDPGKWKEMRKTIRPGLIGPQAIKACLKRAGAAHRLQDIGVSRSRFLQALLHSHQIRERYTILDLARAVGILPARAEKIVDRWVVA